MSVAEQTIFGRIVTGHDVETWCFELLRKWFGSYLSEVERQHELAAGTLERPRAFVQAPSLDKWPEDQLPAVLLISVGTRDRPRREGGGRYRALWDVAAACVCSASTQEASRRNAMLYVAALRALFVQRPSLDGKAIGTDWLTEAYDDLPYDDYRSLAAGIAGFTVEVENVTSGDAGPLTPGEPLDPDTTPWPPWPEVESTHVEIREES